MMDGQGPVDTGEIGMDGKPIMNSSVPIEPEVDDDAIHISGCKEFLISDIGMQMHIDAPAQYQDIFTHMKAHMLNLMQTTAGQNQTPPGVAPPTNQGHIA
jgi:hypothetical protein